MIKIHLRRPLERLPQSCAVCALLLWLTPAFLANAQTLRSPDYPSSASQTFARGLYHEYYEGNWSALPNFDNLNPLKRFWSGGFSLIRFNSGNNFAYRFTGFIDVPSDGTYTFYTTSTDGSKLLIGSTVVVNNDGLHGMQERSGTIGLKAGLHAFTVQYFHATGPFDGLEVRWEGPGIGKQIILSGGANNVLYRIDDGVTHYIVNTFVEIEAVTQKSPPQITLNWVGDPTAGITAFHVYRKDLGASDWGKSISDLPASATSYPDRDISVGVGYEYKVEADVSSVDYISAIGYIYAGLELPLLEDRGKVILLVDDRYSADLASELSRLQRDLVGDGWQVLRHDVSPDATVASVKSLIKSDYDADPAHVKALFLFGHIPLPYSGFYRPGHNNSTLGAWASDTYYGNFAGPWTDDRVDTRTDVAIGTTTPLNGMISNLPGDGKFDQTFLPSDVVLEIGRVDFDKVTIFAPKTEEDLLRQYLNKDHNFRQVLISLPKRRGYMQNNAPVPLADGYNSFSGFFGNDGIDFYDNVIFSWAKADHLMAVSSPPPDYTGADFKTTFILTYISGVPEWDLPHSNLPTPYSMKDALGMPTWSLASAATLYWNWYLHPMALGKTLGYATRISQNNKGLYTMSPQAGDTSMEMLGDPTLRLHPYRPASNLIADSSGASVNLRWTGSPDNPLGYNIYRSTSATGPFTRLNSSLVTATSYTDSSAPGGSVTYMVRAVRLETSGSGSYYNPSQGVFATASVSGGNQAPSVSLSSPAAQSTFNAPATINLSATASDADGSVTKVEFFQGGTLLGVDTSSPFTYSWSNVAGGNYSLTAKATDNTGAATLSSPVSITVNATDLPPAVSLTSPADNASFTTPASIVLSASASDSDGSVVEVAFYQGQTLLGTDNSSPFSYDWANVPAGDYTLSARATDNDGAVSISPGVSISVTASNALPTVQLSSPADHSVLGAPVDVTMVADASDPDGNVAKVEFFAGAGKLGEAVSAPFSFTWANVPIGTYSLTAVATDDSGGQSSSPPISLTVTGAYDAITIEAESGTLEAPMTASADPGAFSEGYVSSDADEQGRVSWDFEIPSAAQYVVWCRVLAPDASHDSFYVSMDSGAEDVYDVAEGAWSGSWVWTRLNGRGGGSPMTIDPRSFDLSLGTHRLTFRTRESGTKLDRLVITSDPEFVPAEIPPSVDLQVGILSPTNNSVFVAPAIVTISATASETGGTISRVDFFADNALLGTAYEPPYVVSWTNVSAGAHVLKAKAVDALNVSKSSSDEIILVNPSNDLLMPALQDDRSVELTVNGIAGETYMIKWSTDLKNWNDLIVLQTPDGTATFTDTNASAYTFRFYKAELIIP